MSLNDGMWSRVQRMELELTQAKRTHQDDLILIARLIGERDLARSLAVSLEGENAQLQVEIEAAYAELETAPLDVVMVPVRGTAT